MSDKKKMQLGMNPSTASHRLVKDVLWSLIVKTEQHDCCKCGEPMSRETFSIEHLDPWLDSDDPVGLYFDLDNIGFSHLRCNVADARSGSPRVYESEQHRIQSRQERRRGTRPYCPEKRRQQYLTRGT